jgi:hypothetical protein
MIEYLLQLLQFTVIPFLVKYAVIWLPIALLPLFQRWWRHTRTMEYLEAMDWIMLEIKVPKDVHKTPEAMELILVNSLWQGSKVSNWFDRNWKGQVLSYFTLELVSIEGNVYFFIRAERRFKNLIETQIYSQFPTAEVNEVDDYTKYVPKFVPGGDWEVRGIELKLDKDDVYPIKTYIDYGMDSKSLMLEEEQKVDPMTPLIELFGSLKAGEQMWMQIFVRAAGKDLKLREAKLDALLAKVVFGETEQYKHLRNPKTGEPEDWQEQGRRIVNDMLNEYASTTIGKDDSELKVGGYRNLPPDKKDLVDRIERAIAKHGFDVGIRIIYYAKKDAYNGNRVLTEITSVLRPFNAPKLSTYNSLSATEFTNDFNFPWQDWNGVVAADRQKRMFDYYVKRAYFYPPATRRVPFLFFFKIHVDRKIPFTLNSEELATIFHFPGRVSATGTFERIAAQKAEPPANLPL